MVQVLQLTTQKKKDERKLQIEDPPLQQKTHFPGQPSLLPLLATVFCHLEKKKRETKNWPNEIEKHCKQ